MVDGTGEGEMNAAYKLRVKITSPNDLCFFLVIFECMRGEDGDLEAGFSDGAVHEMMKRARLSKKAVLWAVSPAGLSSPQQSAQEGPSDRPPPTTVFFHHREPASLRRTCFRYGRMHPLRHH
jgi:hypothetical protein